MSSECLTVVYPDSCSTASSRKRGRPKLRLKDTLTSELKWSGIIPGELEASAADKSAWRSLASRAAAAFKEDDDDRIQRRQSRFFYSLLTASRTVSNTYAQVTRAQSCTNHEQHIGVSVSLLQEREASQDCILSSPNNRLSL